MDKPQIGSDGMALVAGILRDNAAEVDAALRAGADPNQRFGANGGRVMDWAVLQAGAQVVKTLIQAGACLADKDHSMNLVALAALRTREKNSQPAGPVVAVLLEAGAPWSMAPNIFRDGESLPVLTAVLAAPTPNLDVAQVLLAHGAPVDDPVDPPLHAAAAAGLADWVDRLLDAGASVDALDARGCTALILASECGHLECAERLLERGADLDVTYAPELAPKGTRRNALGAASHGRHDAIVSLLEATALARQLRAAISAPSGLPEPPNRPRRF